MTRNQLKAEDRFMEDDQSNRFDGNEGSCSLYIVFANKVKPYGYMYVPYSAAEVIGPGKRFPPRTGIEVGKWCNFHRHLSNRTVYKQCACGCEDLA